MQSTESDFQAKLLVNIFTEVFKSTIHGIAQSSKWIAYKGKETDIFGSAARNYSKAIEERYNYVRIFGMSHPIPLRNIYVKVNVLSKISSQQHLSIESLEKIFDRDTRGFGSTIETIDGSSLVDFIYSINGKVMDFVNKKTEEKYDKQAILKNRLEIFYGKEPFNRELARIKVLPKVSNSLISGIRELALEESTKFIILGKPGSGKSTLLKYLALITLDDKSAIKRLPVFVTIKDYADSEHSLLEYIVHEFDICGLPEAKPFVEQLLNKGKCLVLLDGLDEVSQLKKNQVIKEIKDFSEKFNSNQIIISCRVAAYNHWFEKFTDLEIADFSESQIRAFIESWFPEGKAAEMCWQKIEKDPQVRELSTIPLLLTLLCITFEQTLEFPKNRAELYKESIDALLKRWDASRLIVRSEAYGQLSLKRKETLLSRVAFETFKRDQYFVDKRILEKHISDFMKHFRIVDDQSLEADSEAVLKSIEIQHGILVERAKNIYSFSHLTFQEYFSAKFIAENAYRGTLERLVSNNLTSSKWREVGLLVVSMLDEADEFMVLLRDQINTFRADDPLLKSFLASVYSVLNENDNYPISLNRCMAILFIARTLRIPLKQLRAFHLFESILRLTNMVNDAAGYYLRSGISRDTILDEITDEFVNKNGAIQVALSFDLSVEFINKITKYINANIYLLECLTTDCFVQIETKVKILNGLLSPE